MKWPVLAAILLGSCVPYVAAVLFGRIAALVGMGIIEVREMVTVQPAPAPQFLQYIGPVASVLGAGLVGLMLGNARLIVIAAGSFLAFELGNGLFVEVTLGGVGYFQVEIILTWVACLIAFSLTALRKRA